MIVDLNYITCKRCNHSWLPRKKEVRICPSCKTAWWDVEPEKKIEKLKETVELLNR